MQFAKQRWQEILLGAFVFATLSVWYFVFAYRQTNLLRVYFLNVGKGDAILIDSPTHARMLIDGGPDATVLAKLGQILPFGERTIDVMIESNSSAGSVTGLVDVLKEYKVSTFLSPEISGTSYAQTILNEELQNQHIQKITARAGTIVDLGRGVQLQFIFSKSAIAQIVYDSQTIPLSATSTQKMIEIETDGEKQL